MITKKEFENTVNILVKGVVKLILEETGWENENDALTLFYESDLYKALLDYDTYYFRESAGYLFETLVEELKSKKTTLKKEIKKIA